MLTACHKPNGLFQSLSYTGHVIAAYGPSQFSCSVISVPPQALLPPSLETFVFFFCCCLLWHSSGYERNSNRKKIISSFVDTVQNPKLFLLRSLWSFKESYVDLCLLVKKWVIAPQTMSSCTVVSSQSYK